MSEPLINSTVRAVVHARLATGIDARVVREAVARELVEAFADSFGGNPPKGLLKDYLAQTIAAVEAAIRAYPDRSQPCSPSSTDC